MDKSYFFDRNLLALSQRNPELCARLSRAETTRGHYKFLESRGGHTIPALLDSGGAARPLHSIIDPVREAKRLVDSVEGEGFLIFLGLGGGYYAEAALENEDTAMVLVIEYELHGLAELLCHRDYARLFGDPRFMLLCDISHGELEKEILKLYQPVLYGGIRVIPLRSRTGFEERFNQAGAAITSAIDKTSADYSVQAHFGRRWFSNIIRNIKIAGQTQEALPPIRRAAITAAGPSLNYQIDTLRKKRDDLFLIAADTSLPCLLNAEIKPDAVISIDCQHISYYHFMEGFPKEVFLFLDLASPPSLASHSSRPIFFSGPHPLARYISHHFRALPELDSSGGNVTYAALSLAEKLGAREIELYGADFSYPGGVSYAKGTYVYSYFGARQNRLSPLEAQHSALIFRSPLEKISRPGQGPGRENSWYYENRILKFYRERLEEKSSFMEAELIPVEGLGAPIRGAGPRAEAGAAEKLKRRDLNIFALGKALVKAEDFLANYKNEISLLKRPGKNSSEYMSSLKSESQAVLATLLPSAAAIKRLNPNFPFAELFEETRSLCLKEIDALSPRD